MQLASSYNRDTFAIPGRLSDASFEGNNRLIAKQEAVLVADEETIPVTLGWAEALCRQHRSPLLRPGDTPQQRTALQLLQQRGPLSVDAVAALMSIGVDAASVLLLELEMTGRVGGDGNKFFVSL
jgi:DNA processing protein